MRSKSFFSLLTIGLILACAWAKDESPSGDYKYIDYDKFYALIERIKQSPLNNILFRITDDAFAKYNIAPVPFCKSYGKRVRCKSPIIEIGHFSKGDEFMSRLPTALLIGGFHGDEVIGTNALYYMLELIMENYETDPYYANLLDNVHVLVLPMANVNGFNRRAREEMNVINNRETSNDPNRDFPFDPEKKKGCFKTSTALLMDAVFRKNLVIGCITFHGGDNSITYPWGNFPHEKNPICGDNVSFSSIATMMRDVAGNNPSLNVISYTTGTMQDIVYNVNGGFEDWAYGSSFDSVNINKKCGVYDNPEMGLVKDNIHYDNFSNRAFVYLVEAGFSKIPDERFLGNSVPLVTKDYSRGKWGHVTRNINLSLRFLQAMRPHGVLLSLSYSDVLTVKAAVYGCVKIDEITAPGYQMKELSREYDQKKNIWILTMQYIVSPGVTRSVSFDVSCDKNFADRAGGDSPQTHFAKLRAVPNYKLEYNNKKLTSCSTFSVKVLNIRTDKLRDGVIHWGANNINVVTYTTDMRASLPDVRKQTNEVIQIHYSAEKISFSSVSSSGVTTPKNIRIRQRGGQIPFTSTTERHLINLEAGEEKPASLQYFLSLAGRDVDVYEIGQSAPLFTSTLTLDMQNEETEDVNALLIPESGLNCVSTIRSNDMYYVRVNANGMNVKTEVFTAGNDYFTYKLAGFSGDLKLEGTFEVDGLTLNRYVSEKKVSEIDDLRLLLRTFKLFLKGNQMVFSCVLVQGDPNVQKMKGVKGGVTGVLGRTSAVRGESSLVRVIGIVFGIVLFGALVVFLYRKNQQKKRRFVEQHDSMHQEEGRIVV